MQVDTKSGRIPLWDNLRFGLIFLVVLGHIAEPYLSNSVYLHATFFYIYTFHMPAFVFVSGLFCKKTVDNKNYARILSYFVLYVLIKIISYLSKILIYGNGGFSLLTEVGIPWYAFALFAFSLITVFLRRFNHTYILVASIILACFAGYDNSLGDEFVIMRIINFFPFFFAGYMLKPDTAIAFLKKKAVVVSAFAVMVILFTAVFFAFEELKGFRPLLSGRNPFSLLPEQFSAYGGLLRAAYYILTFVLVGCVIALTPQFKTVFTPFGARTVQAYALHIILIRLFYLFVNRGAFPVSISSPAFLILLIPFAITIAVLCSLKIFEKPFNLLLSPGKAKEIE